VALISVVTVGSLLTSNAAGTSARAVRTADAYDHAAAAIAAEESIERKYRLQPGPGPKAAHAVAEVSLQQAMRQVAVLGGTPVEP
jgi:diguanylate cyclase